MQNIEAKLTRLDSIDGRLDIIDGRLSKVTQRVDEIESSVHLVAQKIKHCETSVQNIDIKVNEAKKVSATNDMEIRGLKIQLRDKILQLQSRTMRHNLVFSGITEEPYPENSELLVKNFIKNNLDITEEIEFENVHRFGRRLDDRPRQIVARFTHFKHRELVRKSSSKLAGTRFRISEQFPKEIESKRRELYPVMRKARDWNNRAFLKFDKLYINGKLYVDPELAQERPGEVANVESYRTISYVPDNRQNRQDRFRSSNHEQPISRASKRQRVYSSESGSNLVDDRTYAEATAPNTTEEIVEEDHS
ncbi:hypothetical protein KUTeg_002921 [Tegillarca granosa]|uniref:Uncharacterized protein n=1 Tax=Tegillarca granosa TaxID=220873 RepID=A0ABQ9FTP9_TEGGR|nr:hypothetical protein KUTeg_002921 [Tegillarca granosa]